MSGTNNRKFYTYDSFIFCPVGHKNVSGLDECASCNMPLINFRKELSTLISNLESINGEKHNKIINFGLGTFGSQILLSLKNDFGSEQLFNYLMIDYEGSNVDSLIPDNDDSLEHNSYSVDNDYDSKLIYGVILKIIFLNSINLKIRFVELDLIIILTNKLQYSPVLWVKLWFQV